MLTWDLMWTASIGNHGSARGTSKHRRSNSSCDLISCEQIENGCEPAKIDIQEHTIVSDMVMDTSCPLFQAFLAATKQLCERFCLSVRHTFLYVPVIISSWNSQDLWRCDVITLRKVKVRGQTQFFSHLQTVTLAWIHIWRWNDAQSLMWHRRGALLFFKVIYHISMWQGPKNWRFWTKLSVSGLSLQFEFTNGFGNDTHNLK